jgi:hypothetical protein
VGFRARRKENALAGVAADEGVWALWPYCSAIDYFQAFGRKRMPPQSW